MYSIEYYSYLTWRKPQPQISLINISADIDGDQPDLGSLAHAVLDSLLCDTTYQPLVRKKTPFNLAFTAYPNPGKDFVVVELVEKAKGPGVLTLSDMLGRVVQSQDISDGDQQVYLLLNTVPAGLYHLTVEIGEQTSAILYSIVN